MGCSSACWLTFMVAPLLTSCVIPIPATPEDADAGPVSLLDTPIVLDSTPQMPGPITINLASPFLVSLVLRDHDIADTLYIRVFRDYQSDKNRGPVTDTMVANDPVNGTEDRQKFIDTNTWCATPSETQIPFDVIVADQPFETNLAIEPIYQAVKNNGRWSKRSWVAKCVRL